MQCSKGSPDLSVLGPTEEIPDEEGDGSSREAATINLDEAIIVAERVAGDILEDVGAPFQSDVLEAAAVLKIKAPDRYARLKGEVVASNADTNEWKSLVKDRALEIKTKTRRRGDVRPIIEDTADLHIMVDDSCEALCNFGGIYERGGELVEIIEGIDGPEIRPIAKGRIREILSRAARFERWTKDGAKPMKPPTSVVDSVHARSSWDMPNLRGFVEGACMMPDGSVLTTGGYHPNHEIFVRRPSEVTGLMSPSKADAERSRKILTDLLVDFELVDSERGAHESAWISALLTILARPAISGSTPFFLFDANQPRVGKTRLAEMICEIATGRSPTPQAAPSGRDADSEMQKTITGIARAGVPIVFFDNVKGKLGGPSLELAITAKRWSARILGESRTYEGELMLTWLATSNNAQLTPDMHGRTLLIRIKNTHESPEQRTGFKYPSIIRHVRENRDRYLQAALTILRAWHVAGRPQYELTPWGSFEEWGEVIRNAIVHAGGQDPFVAREGLIDADNETRAARAVLRNWPEGVELTSSDISQALKDGYVEYNGGMGMSERNHQVVKALNEFLSKTHPRSISYQLNNWKDRVTDGRVLVREKDSAANMYVWRVKAVR